MKNWKSVTVLAMSAMCLVACQQGENTKMASESADSMVTDNKMTESMMKDETKDKMMDETTAMMKDETKDMMMDETTAMMKDESKDKMMDETTAMMKDESKDMMMDETTEMMKDESKDMMTDETTAMMKDESKDMMMDETTAMMKDETKDKMMDEQKIDFKLSAIDGKTYQLADFKGKKVYVKFWASWCPICLSTLSEINELAGSEPDFEIITVVAPNYQNEKSQVDFEKWYKTLGYDHLKVLYDTDGKLLKQLGIHAYPSSAFINTNGQFEQTRVGHITLDEVQKMMAELE